MGEKSESSQYPSDRTLEAYCYNNISPDPLYLFINEHPIASPRCRSGSLETQAADQTQSSLCFQTGCAADSCTLECV